MKKYQLSSHFVEDQMCYSKYMYFKFALVCIS